MCIAASPAVPHAPATSLATLAAACGGDVTAADVCALSDAEVTDLLEDQKVNVLLAKRIRAEVAAEARRQRRVREAEAARLAAEVEAQRAVASLGEALARMGAEEVSEAGLIVLVAAGLTGMGAVCALDAATAAAHGLLAEDAQRVGALVRPTVGQEAITIDHCSGRMEGKGTPECHGTGPGTATGGAELDLIVCAVFWKATVMQAGTAILGAVGNAAPAGDSRSDPTDFGYGVFGFWLLPPSANWVIRVTGNLKKLKKKIK